jgi:hypothetical protein
MHALIHSLCQFVQESQDHYEKEESVAEDIIGCGGQHLVYFGHRLL